MKTLSLLLAAAALFAPRPAGAQDQDWAGQAQAQIGSALQAFREALPRPPANIPNPDLPRFAVVRVMASYHANADKGTQDIDRAAAMEQVAQLCKGKLNDLDAELVGEPVYVVDDNQVLNVVQLCKTPGPSAYNVVLLHTKDTHYLFAASDAEKSAKKQLIETCAGLAPDAELIPGFVAVTSRNFVDTLQACRYRKPF